MTQRLAVLTVVLSGALGSLAFAHHSHVYDECKNIAIEGQVERVEFKNPHNLIVLRVDDGTTYAVDWISVSRLTSAGIVGAAKAAVVSGARIAVASRGRQFRLGAEAQRLPSELLSPVTVAAGSPSWTVRGVRAPRRSGNVSPLPVPRTARR